MTGLRECSVTFSDEWSADPSLRTLAPWGKPVFEHTIDEIAGARRQAPAPSTHLLESGIHTFHVGGVPVDSLLRAAMGQPLFVFLTPLVNRPDHLKLPVFVGQRVSPDEEIASILSISDPVLGLDREIRVAWFQGVPALKVPRIVLSIISFYREHLRAPFVILVGGSSAGFASMCLLPHLRRCIALIWNAQVDISRFDAADVHRYASLFDRTTCQETAPALLRRKVQTDATRSLRLAEDQALFALQNANDVHHLSCHWPLLMRFREDHLCASPRERCEPRIHPFLGRWGKGHVPLPREVLRDLLQFISSRKSPQGDNLYEVMKSLPQEIGRLVPH